MSRLVPVALALLLPTCCSAQDRSLAEKKTAIERGALAVRGKAAFNPPVWSFAALENVWKQWGLKERPKDLAGAFRDRYGLHEAPYENAGLPMGLHEANWFLGKGIAGDCLTCHAGTVAGQTIIGVGNASIDVQSMLDDMFAAQGIAIKFPVHFSHERGTIDPVSPVAFLMGTRGPDLKPRDHIKLDYFDNILSDPPAWWLLKRKATRGWTGNVDARATRIDMINLLTPFNSADHIKKQEPVFADIHAFILSVESPRYPFAVDAKLAERGRALFHESCARCHGTYGPEAKYPSKIVPLKTIGTDPLLAQASTGRNIVELNKSWLTQDLGPDKKPLLLAENLTYQAPPLDGVWATAPYFHNASVPTLYHVLNSKARPSFFTRSYRTGPEDYDQERLGWKIAVLDRPPDAKLPPAERRRTYNTTLPGRSNAGHTFGDALSEDERRAVIEYLKAL